MANERDPSQARGDDFLDSAKAVWQEPALEAATAEQEAELAFLNWAHEHLPQEQADAILGLFDRYRETIVQGRGPINEELSRRSRIIGYLFDDLDRLRPSAQPPNGGQRIPLAATGTDDAGAVIDDWREQVA